MSDPKCRVRVTDLSGPTPVSVCDETYQMDSADVVYLLRKYLPRMLRLEQVEKEVKKRQVASRARGKAAPPLIAPIQEDAARASHFNKRPRLPKAD